MTKDHSGHVEGDNPCRRRHLLSRFVQTLRARHPQSCSPGVRAVDLDHRAPQFHGKTLESPGLTDSLVLEDIQVVRHADHLAEERANHGPIVCHVLLETRLCTVLAYAEGTSWLSSDCVTRGFV